MLKIANSGEQMGIFRLWTAVRGSEPGTNWKTSNLLRFMGLAMFPLVALIANAADLKPPALEAWDSYIQTAEASMQDRLQPGKSFLSIDEVEGRAARVHGGEILAFPIGPHIPKRIPSGLIHHWAGAAFFPNAKLEDVLAVVRDYGRYKQFFHPVVVASKGLGEDRFSLTLMNPSVFQHNALDSDYESKYVQVDPRRWYSVSRTTRMQEIKEYGQSGERMLPAGTGSGYIWRLYSITRFEERDGGVYVEVEAMALSRDIPASFRWIADPIVRRTSRNSVLTSLRQTMDAVAASSARGPSSKTVTSSFRQH